MRVCMCMYVYVCVCESELMHTRRMPEGRSSAPKRHSVSRTFSRRTYSKQSDVRESNVSESGRRACVRKRERDLCEKCVCVKERELRFVHPQTFRLPTFNHLYQGCLSSLSLSLFLSLSLTLTPVAVLTSPSADIPKPTPPDSLRPSSSSSKT